MSDCDGSGQQVFATTSRRCLSPRPASTASGSWQWPQTGSMWRKPRRWRRCLFDKLPGYPDKLMRGQHGRIWLGFSGPRSPKVDAMADTPFFRALSLRLPRALWPKPKPYGHVFAFTEDGQVVADLQHPSGAYPQTTGVTETADRLCIQNLHLKVQGWKARRAPHRPPAPDRGRRSHGAQTARTAHLPTLDRAADGAAPGARGTLRSGTGSSSASITATCTGRPPPGPGGPALPQRPRPQRLP